MKPEEPEIDPALPTTVTPSGRVVYDPLRARRVEVDGRATGEMSQLLGELRALDDGDARDAVPEPVALAPSSGGALITEEGQDAAKAHVEAPVPSAGPAGRIESAPVKVVDPRRAATVRIEKKSPWILDAGTAEPTIDKEALPSATAPSSRPPPPSVTEPRAAAHSDRPPTAARIGAGEGASSKRIRALLLAAILAAGLAAFLWLRAPREPLHESATGVTSGAAPSSATPRASATDAASQPSAGSSTSVESGTTTASPDATASPEATGSAPATTASPEATGSAPGTTASNATSAKSAAPRTSADPYADAGAAPKPTASAAPTVSGGSVAPVVTAVPSAIPSVAPAVSSAPSSKPAPDDDFYIRSKKKKETATP
jgi:hypothetical protein